MITELFNGKKQGQWNRVLVDEFGDRPRWSALLRCPECNERLSLINHTIDDQGRVFPSVGHPLNKTCPWHTSPKLVGWAPCPAAPEPRPLEDPCATCGKRARQLGGWAVGPGGLMCPDCFGRCCVAPIGDLRPASHPPAAAPDSTGTERTPK